MMSSLLRSPKLTDHASQSWHESSSCPGVRFSTRCVSLAGRIELTKMIGEITARNEFLQAGGFFEKLESSLADLLARKVYLEWGICQIQGLTINGQVASISGLIDHGPETLSDEMVSAIRHELGLSEEERKNF